MRISFMARALALALTAAGVSGAPVPAMAQSRDVVCNRCVDTRDIDRRAVTRGRLANDAVNFRKLNPGVENAIKQDRTFAVSLDGNGDEATLVTQGPLRMFARCRVNVGGNDKVEIILTSTANGWYVTGSPTALNAGDEVVGDDDLFVNTGTTGSKIASAAGAIAPDGSVIGPFSLIGAVFNTFGTTCLVRGTATAFSGTP